MTPNVYDYYYEKKGPPYPLLCGQVLLLIIRGFWAEYALIQTSHYVLFHLVHHLLHRL